MKLVERDMVANPVTLKPLLEQDPALKELGGVGYLAQLTGNGAALLGARDFATQIYDLALLRQLVHVGRERSEEHTSELQSVMRISYAVFCLNKKTIIQPVFCVQLFS